jgi:hypothetical protein
MMKAQLLFVSVFSYFLIAAISPKRQPILTLDGSNNAVWCMQGSIFRGLDEAKFVQGYYSPKTFWGNPAKSAYVITQKKAIPCFEWLKLCNLSQRSRLSPWAETTGEQGDDPQSSGLGDKVSYIPQYFHGAKDDF